MQVVLIMKKKNNVKKVDVEIIRDINEDTDQIKKFIFILIGVAIVAVLLYFISSRYVIKDGVDSDETLASETISYDKVDVGNVFNRPYDEYYVMAYDPDSLKASYYAALLNNFTDDKIYFLDLSIEINKKYVGETSNKKATVPSELSLTEPTLIKIKDGKIAKYLDTLDDIEKELK